nr:MAG TPA: hypothetical protein [Caudoviricetes sp.]
MYRTFVLLSIKKMDPYCSNSRGPVNSSNQMK